METSLTYLRERILAASAARTSLRLRGSGSKDFYGETLVGEVLDTRDHVGIVDYEPSELVITARCGTPLAEIEDALTQHGQCLPFEPPAFREPLKTVASDENLRVAGVQEPEHTDEYVRIPSTAGAQIIERSRFLEVPGGEATIGGVIATGLSGPRRAYVGAARDFVLGAHLLDAQGELLRFGGQVMKNVAGFDVARLLCGSLGVLGLIAQVSLKVLPRPREETTLCFECSAAEALAMFQRWRALPLPISATCWHEGVASVRLSGSPSALRAACTTLGGTPMDDAQALAWWSSLRHQTHEFFHGGDKPLWRLSLPATASIETSGGDLIEWSGALRWLRSDAPAVDVRARVEKLGGTATLWRGERNGTPMFHPLAKANLELHQRLKSQFDPNGIFNPARMSAEF